MSKQGKPTSLSFQAASCFPEMRPMIYRERRREGFRRARSNQDETKRFTAKNLGKDAGEGVKKGDPVKFRPVDGFLSSDDDKDELIEEEQKHSIASTNTAIGFGAAQQQRVKGTNDGVWLQAMDNSGVGRGRGRGNGLPGLREWFGDSNDIDAAEYRDEGEKRRMGMDTWVPEGSFLMLWAMCYKEHKTCVPVHFFGGRVDNGYWSWNEARVMEEGWEMEFGLDWSLGVAGPLERGGLKFELSLSVKAGVRQKGGRAEESELVIVQHILGR
ncbi:hypothetical protein K435DRAFT_909197 [Dendrothele bispora CBS 962.96]|uniref:Uncharacterized protein n=1 Tax=Dendrothele bispora (strain CBS 962.96) TaxID=1314807 RepID=A0A4V6T5A4_DENBC|nr:hypothetical protein K435DRAFT_909197 [Dendrothele bispora CBS 962.96]